MTAYRRPLLTAVTAVTAAALLLSACNSAGTTDGNTTAPASPVTVTSTAATQSSAAMETTAPSSATISPAPVEPTDHPLGTPAVSTENREPVWDESGPLVTAVRIGRHDTFTRVVYDIIGDGEPGWITQYVTQPYQQGSGFDVDVQGEAFLMVNITGTTYPFEQDHEGLEVGPFAGAGVVREVVNTGTFEGHTLTYIGLEKELPYSVTLLHNPTRVVVDIQHP